MRQFSIATLTASVALTAHIISVQPVSAQALQCKTSRTACLKECAPAGTNLNTVRCQATCQKPYEQCLKQVSVTRPLQGDILENSGPSFGPHGPAATGSPAVGAPTAPPPAKIY